MRVLIVEDEQIAFEKLTAILRSIEPDIEIVAHLKSVETGRAFLEYPSKIDLAFFDIQLEDGLSFSILDNVVVEFPIVFTTAYDAYAIRAFDHHSIAYLLKPIRKSDVEKALSKFRTITIASDYTAQLLQAIQTVRQKSYKERFTVKIGERIRLVDVKDIVLFYSQEKATYLHTASGKNYLLDDPLDKLETLLNPNAFFRINRKHIVQINYVENVVQHSNSRLKVNVHPPFNEEMIVAREKVKQFKEWLEGE